MRGVIENNFCFEFREIRMFDFRIVLFLLCWHTSLLHMLAIVNSCFGLSVGF